MNVPTQAALLGAVSERTAEHEKTPLSYSQLRRQSIFSSAPMSDDSFQEFADEVDRQAVELEPEYSLEEEKPLPLSECAQLIYGKIDRDGVGYIDRPMLQAYC